MRKKYLLDSTNIIVEPLFTKEAMVYPNTNKLKPPRIDLYDGTKDQSQEGHEKSTKSLTGPRG